MRYPFPTYIRNHLTALVKYLNQEDAEELIFPTESGEVTVRLNRRKK